MTMLETMARAMAAHHHQIQRQLAAIFGDDVRELFADPEEAWRGHIDMARVALEAMKEPTDAMMAAGRDFPTYPMQLGNGQTVQMPGLSSSVDNVFRAMISAALSEKP